MTKKEKGKLYKKATKLQEEIKEITTELYNLDDKDYYTQVLNLQSYKDEILRGFVIYLHLAIDNILREIMVEVLKNKSKAITVKKLKQQIEEDISSREVIEWAGTLDIVSKKDYLAISELNRIRNKLSHNWLYTLPVFKKIKKKRIRQPLIIFQNKSLFQKDNFSKIFLPLYSGIYLRLFSVMYRLKYQ